MNQLEPVHKRVHASSIGKNFTPSFMRKKRDHSRRRQNSRLAWDSRVTARLLKLDLQIECQRLPKKDSFSQADAFCGIWELPPNVDVTKKVSRLPTKLEREVGRTEVMRANKNPRFSTTFRLEYKFQAEQAYVIRVYDEDLRYATDLKEHDFIGGCVFTLGELMGGAGCAIARPLGRGKSFVILVGQEIIETREVLNFRFSGQDLGLLEKKNSKVQVAKDALETLQKVNVAKTVLDKFDPYFRLEKLNEEDQSWIVVWKSEVVSDTQNPTWSAARIPLQLLCDDKPTSPLRITLWVYNRFTNDDLVGYVETNVNELVTKARKGIPVFDVMLEKKKLFGGTKLKKAGILKVLKSSIMDIPSMLQYLAGDCELDLIFAVDCSIANGNWREEDSLHFHSTSWLNDYQAVIHRIGTIFDAYEGRREFSMWGYGGVVKGVAQPSFSMGDRLHGAEDLVKAYDETFSSGNKALALGAKAEMKHVIQAAMYRAIRSSQRKQCDTTLVILSTGQIADLQASIDAVCASAEDAPLSIVIVGVGDGDFSQIQELTGGEAGRLRHSNGVPIARDIVNYVHMNEFSGNARECVSEALREVPEQFVQHFLNAGIKPNPPKAVPDFSQDHAASKSGRTPVKRTSSSNKSRRNR